MKNSTLIPIILCGGSGTRLWPLSRKSFPKQFLSINSDDNKSLLQKTLERIRNIDKINDPILICNEDHRFIVAEQMREINITPKKIILEPFAKNTAPAITISALKAIETEKDPYLLILSSDHLILDQEKFIEAIKKGLNYICNDSLLCFGIVPTEPKIGYGYIKAKKVFDEFNNDFSEIDAFIEKPELEKAKEFIKDRRFFWNSGIFLFKAKSFIKEIALYCPEILRYCKTSLKENLLDLEFQRLDREEYAKCPNISIDFALMEKTKKGIVIPLNTRWADIGSWEAVWEIEKKDDLGNFIEGNVIAKKTSSSYIRSEKRLVAAIGVKDLIIIETSDAILISSKNNCQEVKNIVDQLSLMNIPEGQEHKKNYRPWGFYESIVEDNRWQVKLINVNPGQTLSLQKHHHRSEHWVVVSGTAQIEIEDQVMTLFENQSTYIPLGSKHRLSNPGKIPLKLIEVQSGTYLGEDDIIRFEDNYGR